MTPATYPPIRGYRREVPNWERRDLTVCIAAICEENTADPKIIACTDTQVSSHLGKGDMTKTRILRSYGGWKCLVSGNDAEIRTAVRILERHFKAASEVNEANALQLTRNALNERKREKAEELIQGKFGVPYSEFLATGKTRLPDDIFRRAIAEVELIQIDAEFIIVGFTEIAYPMLIETNGVQAVIREDFAVCGEGASLAQASLMNRGHNNLFEFGRTVYAIFEAKRFAQGAPSVGFTTSLTVLHRDERVELLTWDGVQFLDQRRQEFERKQLPGKLEIMPNLFMSLKTPASSSDGAEE